MKVKLGSLNHALRCLGLCLVLGVWDGKGERTPTTLSLEFIGFPGTRRRATWEQRWFVKD